MATSTCLLVFFFSVAQGTQTNISEGKFIVEPSDVEIINSKPINLKCIFSEPVDYCRWYKNDWPFRWSTDRDVRFVGDADEGNCTLRFDRPEVGKHTTKWRCAAVTKHGKQPYTRDAWVFVKSFPRTDYYDNSIEFKLFHVNITGPNTTDVFMELKTDYNTRIRWFLDGNIFPATTQTFADLVDPIYHRVYSTLHVEFSNPDGPIRSVYCVVEYQRNFFHYKDISVFSAAVVAPWYNISDLQAQNLTYDEDYQKTPPRPMILVDDEPIPDDQKVVFIESPYPTLHEFHVKCVESNAFPFSSLTWTGFSDETDIVSDYSEFNETWQTLADFEEINLHGLLRNRISTATISCEATNIFQMDFSSVSVTKEYRIKFVKPTCPPKTKLPSSRSSRIFTSNIAVILCVLGFSRLLA